MTDLKTVLQRTPVPVVVLEVQLSEYDRCDATLSPLLIALTPALSAHDSPHILHTFHVRARTIFLVALYRQSSPHWITEGPRAAVPSLTQGKPLPFPLPRDMYLVNTYEEGELREPLSRVSPTRRSFGMGARLGIFARLIDLGLLPRTPHRRLPSNLPPFQGTATPSMEPLDTTRVGGSLPPVICAQVRLLPPLTLPAPRPRLGPMALPSVPRLRSLTPKGTMYERATNAPLMRPSWLPR